jgi:hypothetical protein
MLLPLGVATAGVRDAPGASLDPGAQISDVYAFRSWENPDFLILIMNVAAGQDPGDGPSYFGFADEVRYRFHIDNDMDGRADDIVYEIRFSTQQRPVDGTLTFPLPYVGNPRIMSHPELRGIVALDGPGSEGITRRQTYTVTEIRAGRSQGLFTGQLLVAVPSNVGPVTMPDYESLAAQGIYTDSRIQGRVFAGQRADSFYGDSGALFDGAAPRRVPPVLTAAEDNSPDTNPFGLNRNEGFNVQTIALELPISRIVRDGRPAASTRYPYIGVYGSAQRRVHRSTEFDFDATRWDDDDRGGWVQVSRMGNPMVNALIIDSPNKDRYNASRPEDDAQFAALIGDPPLARPPTSEIFGIPVPPPPRLDLLNLYLKYPGQKATGAQCGRPCADLLRLDVRVSPTAPANQQRLGALLGGDPAGFPNGRRPNDDAIDFTVRVIGGPALIGARISDGVNFASGTPGAGTADGPGYGRVPGNRLDVTPNGIVGEFPFLATPHDGRDARHAQL